MTRRVRHVLSVYLERGRGALALLRENRPDEAQALLQKRNAAFHNFRVLDVTALEAGLDIAKDPDIQAIWDEIRKVDRDLRDELEKTRDQTAALARRLAEARRKISGYRSAAPGGARFERMA